MGKIRIVTTCGRMIGGKMREPGYTMLEGVCRKNVTTDDVNKAIQLNEAKVVIPGKPVDEKPEKKEEKKKDKKPDPPVDPNSKKPGESEDTGDK